MTKNELDKILGALEYVHLAKKCMISLGEPDYSFHSQTFMDVWKKLTNFEQDVEKMLLITVQPMAKEGRDEQNNGA